jgi:signal transduction histidine kinase/CheY-like chemotaxis protein
MSNRLFTIIILIASLLGILGEAIIVSEQIRGKILADTKDDVASLSFAYEEYINRIFTATDLQLLRYRTAFAAKGTKFNFEDWVAGEHFETDLVVQVSFVNMNGILQMAYFPDRKSFTYQPVDLSDRDHIKIHLNSTGDNAYVSKVLKGRTSGRWSIQVTRKVFSQSGEVVGVIVISLDPYYFSQFYQRANLTDMTATLVGEDGWIRTRSRLIESAFNFRVDDVNIQRAINEISVTEKIISPFDHVERWIALRRVGHWPLVVTVGRSVQDMDHEWLTNFLPAGILSLILAGLLPGTIFYISRTQYRLTLARTARQKAEATAAFRTELLTLATHELRIPLIGIQGTAQTLTEMSDDLTLLPYFDALRLSSETLLAKLDEIFDAYSADSRPPVGIVDVNACIDLAVLMYEPMAQAKGLTLEKYSAANIPEAIPGDDARLTKILFALLHNAVKFTDAGRIIIQSQMGGDTKSGPKLFIDVVDSGVGIEEEMMPYIFDPYFKVDTAASREQGGLGLGLYAAANAASACGWTLDVRSTIGAGSRFRLSIPVSDKRIDLARASPAAISSSDKQNPVTVLILDSNRINAMLFAAGISSGMHIVHQANQIEDAVGLILKIQFDVIFIDMTATDPAENDVLTRLNSIIDDDHRPLFVAITQLDEYGDDELRAFGYFAQISKPYDWLKVKMILDTSRLVDAERR